MLRTDRDDDADRDRERDADPHRTHRLALVPLGQEGGDDADDEGGFDALPETDDERGQHGR